MDFVYVFAVAFAAGLFLPALPFGLASSALLMATIYYFAYMVPPSVASPYWVVFVPMLTIFYLVSAGVGRLVRIATGERQGIRFGLVATALAGVVLWLTVDP